MVYNRAGSVVLVNSDGTGSTTLATTSDLWIAPSSVAATSSVVFHQGDPSTNGKIWVVQPGGTSRLLLSGVTRPESWPRLSPDGVWVYFVRDMRTLWRAKLDGSALDSLTSFTPPQVYRAPTISPDGNSVAIEDGNGLKIVDMPTKATRTLSVTCPNPGYSPDGAFFACAGSQVISIVRTDGTGQRVVAQFSDGRTADPMTGLDWTPDGKWIFALVYGPTLIEVSSGSLIAMTAVNGNVFQPSLVR
jgi:Tol biopolymer transport system component